MATIIDRAPLNFARAVCAVPGTVYIPTRAPSPIALLPAKNTTEVIVYNAGPNVLWFGSYYMETVASWPSNLPGGGGAVLTPTLGLNSTIVPSGSSLTVDIGTYEQRGSMDIGEGYDTTGAAAPLGIHFPLTLLFFTSSGGATTAYLTYVSKLGRF